MCTSLNQAPKSTCHKLHPCSSTMSHHMQPAARLLQWRRVRPSCRVTPVVESSHVPRLRARLGQKLPWLLHVHDIFMHDHNM